MAMTAPERLSDTAPWRDWFEQAMNQPGATLDNAVDPDVIGAYGLEWDRCDCGRNIPGDVDQCDDCTEDGPDPDVCAGCDHQRAFHYPKGEGICLGHCDCVQFDQDVS